MVYQPYNCFVNIIWKIWPCIWKWLDFQTNFTGIRNDGNVIFTFSELFVESKLYEVMISCSAVPGSGDAHRHSLARAFAVCTHMKLEEVIDKEEHLCPFCAFEASQTVQHSGPFSHLSRLMTKPTKWYVRPAKTQISLGIFPVWSVFTVCSMDS